MSQQNIDFGSFPNDPSADAIRTAFQKVQNNFNQLFTDISSQAVLSVNQTPGAGISVNSPTGNVVVSANIACVQVQSSTLGIGIGSNTSNYAVLTTSSQVLQIDIPNNLSNIGNIAISGNLIASNITVNNGITTSTVNASGNINSANINGGNLVTANYIAGTLTAAAAAQPNITSVGTLNNLTVAGNVYANSGIVQAQYLKGDGSNLTNVPSTANSQILSGTSNVKIAAPNGNVTVSVGGTINVATFTNSGANITGSANITGILIANNANLGNTANANYFFGSGNNLSNIQGSSVTGAVANATYATSAGSATTAGTITTNAQPNITSVGTLSSLSVTGNITGGNANLGNSVTANYFTGNGSGLSAITGSNVTGQVGYATIANSVSGSNVSGAVAYATTANSVSGANVLGAVAYAATANGVAGSNVSGQVSNASIAGTVYTNAQPNITSVGTLSSLSVTGNITSGNANLGNAVNANYHIGSGNNLSNIQGSNVSGAVANANYSLYAGTLLTNAQPNITSLGTLSSLSVTGNISTGNITGANLVNANYLTGTITTNAQPNITSIGSLGNLSVTGNTVSGNVYANSGIIQAQYIKGDGSNLSNISVSAGSYIIAGTSNAAVLPSGNFIVQVNGVANVLQVSTTGATVLGTLNAGNVSATSIIGTITTASQPNVTSLGTLSSLNVSGISNLGPVSNLTITGGGANYFLMTNGSGGLSWNNATLIPVSGSNTQIQYNNNGNFAGSPALTFNNVSNTLTITGNANVGNLNFGSGILSGTGNIIAGNANLGNLLIANYHSGSGNLLSNIQGANVSGAVSYATVANLVAGANVTGAVAYATTANSVAGANVTGTVANATYATSAGTVSTVTANAQPNITSVGTLTSLSVTGNILGANITGNHYGSGNNLSNIQGSNVSGAVTYATTANSVSGANVNGQVSNATVSGTVYTNAQPNITSVGTLTSLGVTGNITTTGTGTYNIGTPGNQFGTLYATATSALYADLAEKYIADSDYHIGTVVMIGGDTEVTQHDGSDMRALGVISGSPAYKMNDGLVGGTYIALKGRVPVKISGTIRKGQPLRGTVNGKAIGEDAISLYTFAIALSGEIDPINETVEAVIL